MEAQFCHQVVAMGLDGLDAHAEFLRSLFVGFAFGDQLQNLPLPMGQRIENEGVVFQRGCDDPIGNSGTQIDLSADGRNEWH